MRKLYCPLVSLFTLFFLPQLLFGQWRDFTSVSENIKATDGVITEMRLEWLGDHRQVKAQLQGTMEIFAHKPAIKKISEGGRFVLEEKSGTLYRKLQVQNGANGRLSYQFAVQAEPAVFSAIAQKWFENLLLEIVREAGINSRQRTEAIFAEQGERGILREVDAIERERSKRFYYERLLSYESISDSTLYTIASRIGDEFTADTNLKIVISEMVNGHKLSTRTLLAVLRAIREVNNETTRANLLIDVATILPHDAAVHAAYEQIASSIRSTVERQRALSAKK